MKKEDLYFNRIINSIMKLQWLILLIVMLKNVYDEKFVIKKINIEMKEDNGKMVDSFY